MVKPGTTRSNQPRSTPRLHFSAVMAAWSTAVAWIAVEPLTAPHDVPTMRWMNSVTLLLVAVACSIMIAWLVLGRVVEPMNDWMRAFELGFKASEKLHEEPAGPNLTIVADVPHISAKNIGHVNGGNALADYAERDNG